MTLILCVLENSCPKRQAGALPTWFQRPKNQFFKLVLRSICALRKSSRTFFSWNKFEQTPFSSIWRFFMDVQMTKESGVLCFSEWWRPWFEKSEVTGIRQLFYCALAPPNPFKNLLCKRPWETCKMIRRKKNYVVWLRI